MACNDPNCPLLGIEVNEDTDDALMMLAFCTNLHQEECVFSESQLKIIGNEINNMVRKYSECRKKTEEQRAKQCKMVPNSGTARAPLMPAADHANQTGSSTLTTVQASPQNSHGDCVRDVENNSPDRKENQHGLEVKEHEVQVLFDDDVSDISSSLSAPIESDFAEMSLVGECSAGATDDANTTRETIPLPSEPSSSNSFVVKRLRNGHSDNQSTFPAFPGAHGSGHNVTAASNIRGEQPFNDRSVVERMEENRSPRVDRLLYSSFVDPVNKYLELKMIRNGHDEQEIFHGVRGPLGVCYDEIQNRWAVADTRNNQLILWPNAQSVHLEGVTVYPSAICVFVPGQSLVVLCDTSIVKYDFSSHEMTQLIRFPSRVYRGLARTIGGNLVTMRNISGKQEIVVFKAKEGESTDNTPLACFTFLGKNPCFLDVVGARLVISDLGAQSITLCRLDDTNEKKIIFDIIKTHSPRRWGGIDQSPEPNGSFHFVSGVQLDGEGCSLVADAGGYTIQLFDENLNLKSRVSTDFDLPYVSSLAVNNRGEVLLCDRREDKLVFAQLTAVSQIRPVQKNVQAPPRREMGRGGGFAARGRGFGRGGAPAPFAGQRGSGARGGWPARGRGADRGSVPFFRTGGFTD